MTTTYYIDSENVGDNWISLLPAVTEDDEILVFYTQNSPHMNYRNLRLLKESPTDVDFIECCEGSNALDFQLCTELGFRISSISDREFVIVSNDTGFDAVVKYWRKRGQAVRRIQGKACASLAVSTLPAPAPQNQDPAAKEPGKLPQGTAAVKAPVKVSSVQEPPKGSGKQSTETLPKENTVSEGALPEKDSAEGTSVDDSSPVVIDDNAKEILFLVGKDNLQQLHEALQQLYGTKKATAIYNSFKSDISFKSFLASHKKMTSEERKSSYCAIVFSMSEPKEAMPADFPSFAAETWREKKNLNSFRAALQQKYGKEKSQKYYSIFKAHIKILDEIK